MLVLDHHAVDALLHAGHRRRLELDRLQLRVDLLEGPLQLVAGLLITLVQGLNRRDQFATPALFSRSLMLACEMRSSWGSTPSS